jgi:hypothetical protein
MSYFHWSKRKQVKIDASAREWRSDGDTVAVRWRGASHYRYYRGASHYYYPSYGYWNSGYYAPSYYYSPYYDYTPGYYSSYYYSPAYPSYTVPSYRYYYRPGLNLNFYRGW